MLDAMTILGQMAEASPDPRLRNIMKALSSTQAGTDLGALTGGGATRFESMDHELAIAAVQNEHFLLFNKLFPSKVTTWSLIDQQSVKDEIGGYPGGSISNETASNVPERSSTYRRVITELKVMAEFGGVSVPTALQGILQQAAGMADFNSGEEEVYSSLLRIMQTTEWQLLNGDMAIDPLEFTGLIPSILAGPAANITDMAGAALNSGSKPAALAAHLSGFGNWGSPDTIYCSPLVKADFDSHLESGYRVNLDANIPNTEIGALVKAIRYNGLGVGQGILDLQPHVYLDEAIKAPVSTYAQAENLTLTAPASVAGVAAADAASKFLAGHAGDYVYRAEAASGGNVSLTVASAAVTVAAGDKVTLTISQGPSVETYYNIYRGRKGAAGAATDVRLIGRVKKAGATTTFVDRNTTIPGTSVAMMLSTGLNQQAIRLLQMCPPSKLPLALTGLNYRWVIFAIMGLRVAQPKKLGIIKNILPSNATWTPFA